MSSHHSTDRLGRVAVDVEAGSDEALREDAVALGGAAFLALSRPGARR
jgi:hypothetical protein